MMKKNKTMPQEGVVLEIREKYALVMLKEGEVIRIQRKEGLTVGAHIYILPEDRYEENALCFAPQKSTRTNRGRRIAAVAAAIMLCISAMLSPYLSMQAYAVASLDAGQSVQLELDRHGRVIRATSPNGSIEQSVLNGYKGKELEEVAKAMKGGAQDTPCLAGYAKKGQGAAESVEEELRRALGDKGLIYLDGDWDDLEKARELSLSLGLYIAGEQVSSPSGNQLDDLDDLTLEELKAMLRQNPEWMCVPEFADAIEDVLEDALEDEDDDFDDMDDPDDDDDTDDLDDFDDMDDPDDDDDMDDPDDTDDVDTDDPDDEDPDWDDPDDDDDLDDPDDVDDTDDDHDDPDDD